MRSGSLFVALYTSLLITQISNSFRAAFSQVVTSSPSANLSTATFTEKYNANIYLA